jgi:hypothetical protein
VSEGRNHTEHGDRTLARAGEILRTVVGSGVHGIAIAGTDDHDEMGVFIEPPGMCRSAWSGRPLVFRTQPAFDPAPVTLDLVLCCASTCGSRPGNPTALSHRLRRLAILLLTPLGEELRALAPALLSQRAVRRFLGYMNGQRERLLGAGGAPNRPELVARYGYDVKYASHALRLAYQGLEIVRDGRLPLPMPPLERERVLRARRRGRRSRVLEEIDAVQAAVDSALTSGQTPSEDRIWTSSRVVGQRASPSVGLVLGGAAESAEGRPRFERPRRAAAGRGSGASTPATCGSRGPRCSGRRSPCRSGRG